MRDKLKWEKEAAERRGARTVPCQVSDRYISYSKTDPKAIGFGHPVVLHVMKDNYGDKRDRVICEFVTSLEDLEVMVAQLRADLIKKN